MTKASRKTLRQCAQQRRHVHLTTCSHPSSCQGLKQNQIRQSMHDKKTRSGAVHAWQENLNYRVHAAARFEVIMASSEGADCQKQLRVLRLCKNVASYVGNTLFALQFPLRQASGREVAWGITCGSCDLILRGSRPFVNESVSDVLDVLIPNRITNFSRKSLPPLTPVKRGLFWIFLRYL